MEEGRDAMKRDNLEKKGRKGWGEGGILMASEWV